MPQETNLNVSPYFDDFDREKDYYKVLFKPGYPVQARELTTLQSILQNQIEQFGTHFFREGSKVIPGQLTYLKDFYCIQVNSEYAGIPISLYLNELVGKKIRGSTSGVRAEIRKVINQTESERDNVTLYLNYLESGLVDSQREFLDGEILLTEELIQFGSNFISTNEPFASVVSLNSRSIGSAISISNGVYFLRGNFVNINDEIILLDQYSNKPNCRVGFFIEESIVSSDEDITLTDNAKGFNNYASPGADRLRIRASLYKKDIDDLDNTNFVQLVTIKDGILRDTASNSDNNNYLSDILAKRTFDESGHYYVKSFSTYVKESLDNGIGNDGIFKENELTYNGSTPSDDLAIYKISPGQAYVKGYSVEILNPTFLDIQKPRTTQTLENQGINFGFGPTLSVNRVYGSPTIGFNTTGTLSLKDSRIGASASSESGTTIGIARIYDFALESGSYNTSNLNQNVWDLSLFDVQMYSSAVLSEPITLALPTSIRGQSSGATAFLRSAVTNSSTITLYDIKGQFLPKENIIFDSPLADENNTSRVITSIRNYGISDVKSVYSTPGIGITFNADVIQNTSKVIGNARISTPAAGQSTVTFAGTNISGIFLPGNLVSYTNPGISTISYARVFSINEISREIVITSVTDVPGIVYGQLPVSALTVNDFTILTTSIQNTGSSGNAASNESLFSILPKSNISSINLSNSQLTIRRQFKVNITNNSTNPIDSGENETFLPFDEERYTLIRSNGTTEVLTQDKFTYSNGSTRLVINNLSANDTGSILIATLVKSKVTSKSKIKKIVESIIIDKSKYASSGIGQATTNDGLTYGNYPYGTRVQDSEICLNFPDVNILYGIFESSNESDPETPSIVLSLMSGSTATTNDLIIGEEIIGTTSGSRAIYVEKRDDVEIGFVSINDLQFISGESIQFKQSGVTATISIINFGSKNISKEFNLITGQTPTYYDYSRILRNTNSPEPQRKIKVIFTRGYYDSSDIGDITTVNSYNSFEYNGEISNVNGTRVTDIIDFRPRVSNYTVSPGALSPFEFFGRSFNNSNHSSRYVVSPDESIVLTYSYYLPRIDRIYLTKDGIFSIKIGTPSDEPKIPEEVSGAMNIANVYLPAYLYDVNDAKVDFVQHKRYQMKDIYNLENRIKNLEYYTTLSLLETNTSNLFIDDGTGLNRFKSGFFVDNFKSLTTQDLSVGVRNSIDIKSGNLRPSHYTTELSLEIANTTISGIGTATTANQDKKYSEIIGSNIKRSGNAITLNYNELSWLKQPFATRTESVTPFFVRLWEGSIQLHPTTDNWIDVNQLDVYNVQIEGSFLGVAEALNAEITTNADGSRSGVAPVMWNSWETTGIDIDVSYSTSTETSQSVIGTGFRKGTLAEFTQFTGQRRRRVPRTFLVGTEQVQTTNTSTTTNNTSVTLSQSRTGSQKIVTEEINTESFGDRIVNRDIIQFMRSRNIEFTSKKMKPYTQVYSFFDGVNVSDFCFSKLVEIKMNSGIFQVGETVIGVMPGELLTLLNTNTSALPNIYFRVASPNHKYGPYNNPTDIFDRNPYDRNNTIPPVYSSTSNILNIDTYSLSEDTENIFSGNIKKEMKLYGTSSGAEATVTDVRLITDRLGTLIGSYLVPDGNVTSNPKFETGKSRFRLTSSSTNSQIGGEVTTVAEETFFSQGQLDNKQETTLSVRNARVETFDNFSEARTLTSSDSAISSVSSSTSVSSRLTGQYRDPLAQSFTVDDPTGIFVTKLDLYFSKKDESIPVTVQIREVELGVPNQRILPFSEVELSPDKIQISDDASIATTFEFESPVYLEGQREYAIVIISNSTEYNVWISRLGESDVATLGSEQNQILVTTQRLLGSLFKSQNASTWTPSQYEDLAFELYRADFATSGFTQFFNPELPNSLQIMKKDPLTIISNKIRIGLSSSIVTSDLTVGNTVFQNRVGLSSAIGNLVGFAGSSFGALNVISAGVGYTGSSYTYNNISLRSITGSGINATATIVINSGGATSATIVNGGFGYVVGDLLEPVSIGSQNLGTGMRLSVTTVTDKTQLILDNVQGNFEQNSANYLQYVNDSGIVKFIENGGVSITSPPQEISDGKHIKVFHRNHGMHSSSNSVIIKDISSDIDPVSLTAPCQSNSTELLVSNSSIFETFEGQSVSSTNPGYIKILNEIIRYSGTTATSITGVVKGRDNTTSFSYPVGTLVEKYELNGVSLRRINTTHKLSNATEPTIKDRISANHYYIKIDMSANGGNRNRNSDLRFSKTAQVGGIKGKATYNIPFEMIIPNISHISPTGTDSRMSVRTITGTSLGGNQVSFNDSGFQDILNNKLNYFTSSRLIASKINESENLDTLPGNKSLNLNMYMSTIDSRISPMIDLENSKMVFISNVINNPISNYSTDYRVNTLKDDPNLFTYVTNPIELETSASSIKLILDAYVSNTSDIRAFYSIGNNSDVFIPFPGYNNISSNGSVIDIANSDGNPDIKVPKTDIYSFEPDPSAFREYQFTIDGLESFKTFRIKLIGTSENQSNVPFIKNVRAIALASLKRDE